MKTIFDIYSKEEIEQKIAEINTLLSKNISDNEILNKIDYELKEELFSIAKARQRAEKQGSKYVGKILYLNQSDLRFSTPIEVANYRAKRLKCNKIVDLCSGIGIQTFAFSKECNQAYGFEIDERKVKYAISNFSNIKNIFFIKGDVLDDDVIKKVSEIKPDVIFCDPERLESETERKIETIQPNIVELIRKYSLITKQICIELPPQINLDKLRKIEGMNKFEAEYLSYNNKLNRLNIYFGNLALSDVSVSDVNGDRIEKKKDSFFSNSFSNELQVKSEIPLRYIYEFSTAISKAGLEKEFALKIKAKILTESEKGNLMTSNELTTEKIAFSLSKPYKVLGIADSFEKAVKILKESNCSDVVLKYKIDPKKYWQERKKFQLKLSGKKECVIFKFKNSKSKKILFLICRELDK